MIYGSVCSGIEAATVAWHPLGWRPAFFSETEPFPRAVLAHHYPEVPLHGDFTTIKAGQFAAIDVLVGGTPCQSFSISGLRGGLGDDRGNLALEYLRLADRLRPRWVVWENVPGVLSTNDGRDFGAILGGMGELGYGFAWRVLDAQFVRVDGFRRAVPQRRRRVFLVGCARGWPGAAAVLFERSSLSWDSAPRRQSRQEPAADTAASVTRDGIPDASHALNGHGTTGRHDAQGETFIPECFNLHPRNNAPGIVDATPTDVATGINAGLDKVSERGVRILASWRVRRLMPVECERLQGFPDGYTAVPYRGHVAADGPRYKALGNSMAVNVMRWIGSRIGMVDQIVESRQTIAACVQQDVLQRIAL